MEKGFFDSLTKILTASLLTGALLLCLCACDSSQTARTGIVTDEEKAGNDRLVKIYCTDVALSGLYYEEYQCASEDPDGMLSEIIARFDANPVTTSYKKAKSSDIVITGYEFGSDGQLILYFNDSYNKMEPIQEMLCRAAIVKTVCQLENVGYVEFYVDNKPMMLKDIPTGLMSGNDFVEKTGINSEFRQNVKIIVYMTDSEGEMLHESVLMVESDGSRSIEELVLEQLINGPLPDQGELCPVISPDTVVNRVHSSDGICYVDFNGSFFAPESGVDEEVAVYGIVNSLCEISGINKVKITINGGDKKGIGNISFNDFLSMRPELIKDEKAGDSD